MTLRVRTFAWLTYWLSAFVATHLPPGDLPSRGIPEDWLLHLAGFAVLGFVTVWRMGGDTRGIHPRRPAAWLCVLLVYAALDEVTQPWVGRDCSAVDWLADAAGAAIGVGLAWGATRRVVRSGE